MERQRRREYGRPIYVGAAGPTLGYRQTSAGSAFGTTAEEGFEAVPPEESLRKFLAPADLWPIGAAFGYHSGGAGSSSTT